MPKGYRVGAWNVADGIASGSWGSVYAARRVAPTLTSADWPGPFEAALKFLPSGGLTPRQRVALEEAVQHEIRFSERADHPRLVRTFETLVVDDPGEPALDGAVVLVMERAAHSLRDVLETRAPAPPVSEVVRLLTEICEGLAHMHASGWIHGDLKPSNVLVMDDGSIRLADFGLARHAEGTHAYVPRVGSSDYLPPEWWTERIGERGVASRTTGDIWAFGVTAHQLLSGGLFPFPGASARARAAAAQSYADGRTKLRLADAVPPAWRSLIADCLAPDHASRSRHTADRLLLRIRSLPSRSLQEPQRSNDQPLRRTFGVGTSTSRVRPRRKPARELAAAGALAAVVVVVGATQRTNLFAPRRTAGPAPVTLNSCDHDVCLDVSGSGTFVRWARVNYRGPQLVSGDFHVFGPPGYPDLRSPEHAPLSSARDFHARLNQRYPDERLLCGEAWTEGRLLGRPCVVVRAFEGR